MSDKTEELQRQSDEQRAKALELIKKQGSLIDELKDLFEEIRKVYEDG